ncbi:conserved hypothetical protein [Histoplasma capsulatum H143]|uniref:Uncharacterized protein n=1 Tax=Ajellomyces capsulatus (strain H143) TaxID=544712 RepID=C6HEP1_AJECH|nr:conserved hypothetical protein [Histoplasma capsulatum H143]
MAPLSDLVLIAVVCAVTVFLCVLLVTVLCLRYRRKNILHSNETSSNLYPQSRGIFHTTFPFRYAGARQWSAIGSIEDLRGQLSPGILEPAPCHTSERRDARMSTLSMRNTRRLQKKSSRDIPLESVASPRSHSAPSDVENMGFSPFAIAELQADCTPKRKIPLQDGNTTIDKDEGGRITSWPLTTRKGSYYDITATMRGGPFIIDPELAKRRSEGILHQAPGSPPKQEVPPLPFSRPPGIPHLTRHDSMLLSNKSLDTAGSSILDYPAGENLTDSIDLETPSKPPPTIHERYISTDGWWVPASTRSGSVSRIPQASSPRRYNSTSGSYKQIEDRGSPRRSASMHYPEERSSCILGVQTPTKTRQLYIPPLGESRSLTSGPWIPSNICNQKSQLPVAHELNTSSSLESDQPEDNSCKSTPRAKTVTPVRQDKQSSEPPSTSENSHNPFDNDEDDISDDGGGEPTPTPIERGSTTSLSITCPSSVPKFSPAPVHERPNIPRRSSLRRNSSTVLRSQHEAQSQPQRSTSIASTITILASEPYASTPSITTPTNTVSGFPSLGSYGNIIAKMDNEARNLNNGDRPARNAFALPENSALIERETGVSGEKKPRPLPILPIPKLSQTLSRSRPQKFRAALTTIQSASNIAMPDGADGISCHDSDKENGGNAGSKSDDGDDGSRSPTSTSSPSQLRQLEKGEGTESSIQHEGTESPSEKQERPGGPVASTPLKAGAAVGTEKLTSSIVRTPGSMYDQFGFLKE